jgi:hypothetical protein
MALVMGVVVAAVAWQRRSPQLMIENILYSAYEINTVNRHYGFVGLRTVLFHP